MAVPTHGVDCRTRMWRTRCADCNAEVYYLSCTCGSRVYLNLPEPPWVRHGETCTSRAIRDLFENEDWSVERIRRRLEAESASTGKPVPRNIWQTLNTLDGGRRTRRVEVALPRGEQVISGTLFRLVPNAVNFFGRFGIPDTAISRGLLGPLAQQPHNEVVLREDPDEDLGVSFEFAFFIPESLCRASGLVAGRRATVRLEEYMLPSGATIWLAVGAERG